MNPIGDCTGFAGSGVRSQARVRIFRIRDQDHANTLDTLGHPDANMPNTRTPKILVQNPVPSENQR